jgi:hypothetical protein
MFRMMHSKQAKRFSNLRFLVRRYTVFFGELGGALCDEGCSRGWRTALWWLFFKLVIVCLYILGLQLTMVCAWMGRNPQCCLEEVLWYSASMTRALVGYAKDFSLSNGVLARHASPTFKFARGSDPTSSLTPSRYLTSSFIAGIWFRSLLLLFATFAVAYREPSCLIFTDMPIEYLHESRNDPPFCGLFCDLYTTLVL